MRKNIPPVKGRNPMMNIMALQQHDNAIIKGTQKADVIMTLMTLSDFFDFTPEQLQEFMEHYKLQIEAYSSGNVNLKDWLEIIETEFRVSLNL